MKQLLTLLSFLAINSLFSQSATFEQILAKELNRIAVESTTKDWHLISKNFHQVATNHPEEWLVHYYTAYAYMQLAGTYEDQTLTIVAEHLDKAQAALVKAEELSG